MASEPQAKPNGFFLKKVAFYGCVFFVHPFLYVAILRPDLYGLLPNSLDPIFYTAYSFDLPRMVEESGQSHYFITRWPVYLPTYLIGLITGVFWARLIVRWVFWGAIAAYFVVAGRRLSWTNRQVFVALFSLSASAIFARAYFTDYIEWATVCFGILLLLTLLFTAPAFLSFFAFGAFSAILLTVNPAQIYFIIPCFLVLVFRAKSESPKRFFVLVTSVLLGSTVVILGSLCLFRLWFGLDNIYSPTIRFSKQLSGGSDPSKSPHLRWMVAYTWIYIPVCVVLLALASIRTRTRLALDLSNPDQKIQVEKYAAAVKALIFIVSVQYLIQTADQFVRGGQSLELSYYWIYIYPGLSLLVCLLLVNALRTRVSTVTYIIAASGFLFLSSFINLSFPEGPIHLLFLGSFLVMSIVASLQFKKVPAYASTALLLAVPLTAPRFNGLDYHFWDNNPRYQDVFGSDGTSSRVLKSNLWFAQKVASYSNGNDIFFAVDGIHGSAPAGMFLAHITGKLLILGDDAVSPEVRNLISLGGMENVAIFGSADFRYATFSALTEFIDERVYVGSPPGAPDLVLEIVSLQPGGGLTAWRASELFGQVGNADGGSRRALPDTDDPGFVVFGPYVPLQESLYRVTVEYSADGPADTDQGVFDVFGAADGERAVISAVPIAGSSGARVSQSVVFQGQDSDNWEFRVYWFGLAPLTVHEVRLERLP